MQDVVDLSAIQALAEKVGTQHEELTEAAAAERAAQAELLDATVAAVRPALRALASKIQTGYRCWWIGTTRTDDEKTWSEARGLSVGFAEEQGPARHNPTRDQNRGSYTGYDLFLTADGRWLELAYAGSWSRWQGEEDEWEATETYRETAEVVREWNVGTILEEITRALEQQAAGKAPERAKAARERAERIAAVTKLVQR